MTAPKLFISYSWSTPDHEQWVMNFATDLVQSGIDVILDKWDLREGHDAVAFMEKMVTDPLITKVVVVSDKSYALKADGRMGGVGTETQIVSREVYERTAQDKFAAVVVERDADGNPYLPTFFKSRIYIDLSEPERYSINFDKLLRWAFDKPLYIKPELGDPPSFISENFPTSLGTSVLASRAVDAIRNGRTYAKGALEEYLATYSQNVERFRIANTPGDELDDKIMKAIDEFTPSRNELLQVVGSLIQYGEPWNFARPLHQLFESLLTYYERPENVSSWNDLEFDHFKFVTHELFLYCLAMFIRHEDYGTANHLLSEPYYLSIGSQHTTVPFTTIRQYLRSFEARNQRLDLRRLSLRADLLEQRSKSTGIPFRYVMQADFICFMRAELTEESGHHQWWPETLLYAARQHGAFEVFARAASRLHLAKLLPLLGVTSLQPVQERLERYAQNPSQLPSWQFNRIDPASLMGFNELGSRN